MHAATKPLTAQSRSRRRSVTPKRVRYSIRYSNANRTPPHARLLHGILRARAQGRLNEAIEIFELLRDDDPRHAPSPTTTSPSSMPCRVGSTMHARFWLATLERPTERRCVCQPGRRLCESRAAVPTTRAHELDPDVNVRSESGNGPDERHWHGVSQGLSITAAMRSGPPADEPESQDDATIRQEAAAKPDDGVPKMSEAAEETRDSGPRTPGLATEPVLPPVVPGSAATVAGGVPSPDASASAATVAGAMPSPDVSGSAATVAGAMPSPDASASAETVASAMPSPDASASAETVAGAMPSPDASAQRRDRGRRHAITRRVRAIRALRARRWVHGPSGCR